MDTTSVDPIDITEIPGGSFEKEEELSEELSENDFSPTHEEARAEYIEREVRGTIEETGKYDDLQLYMSPFWGYPVIRDPKQWRRLFDDYHNGNKFEAQRKLVYHNMKLVLSIGFHYTGRGVPLLDLLQEGAIGLMKAIEKFEIDKGFAFSTYASWWIRQSMVRAIMDMDDRRAFRVPVHMGEQIALLGRLIHQFWGLHGRWPSNYEVYKDARASQTKLGEKLSLHDVAMCMQYIMLGSALSLDYEYGDPDNSFTIGDRIADPKAKPDAIIEARKLLPDYEKAIGRIERAVDLLPPREAMILRLRFGLGEFDPMTLDEIGMRYELSRERIRQIEVVAFERLETAGMKVNEEEIATLLKVRDELLRIVESV